MSIPEQNNHSDELKLSFKGIYRGQVKRVDMEPDFYVPLFKELDDVLSDINTTSATITLEPEIVKLDNGSSQSETHVKSISVRQKGQKDKNDISLTSRLGGGAKGQVYAYGVDAVMKYLPLNFEGFNHIEERKSLAMEVAVLNALERDVVVYTPDNESTYAFGKSDGNYSFNSYPLVISQKRVPGSTLSFSIDSMDLDFDNLCRLFVSIVSKIEDLHRLGFIHGDLHSENIMVENNVCSGLIDFGASKNIGSVIDEINDYIPDGAAHIGSELGYSIIQKNKSLERLTTYQPYHDLFSLALIIMQLFFKPDSVKGIFVTEMSNANTRERVCSFVRRNNKSAIDIFEEFLSKEFEWKDCVPEDAKVPMLLVIRSLLDEQKPDERLNTRGLVSVFSNINSQSQESCTALVEREIKKSHDCAQAKKLEAQAKKLEAQAKDQIKKLGSSLDEYLKQGETRKISKLRANRVELVKKIIASFSEHVSSSKSISQDDVNYFVSVIKAIKEAHDKEFGGWSRVFHRTNRFSEALSVISSEGDTVDINYSNVSEDLVRGVYKAICNHARENGDFFVSKSPRILMPSPSVQGRSRYAMFSTAQVDKTDEFEELSFYSNHAAM